jgi:hypothetical protein
MQTSHSHQPTSATPASPKASAMASEQNSFMTPPKKTKPYNIPAEKKPSLRPKAEAEALDITIKPFNLLLALES